MDEAIQTWIFEGRKIWASAESVLGVLRARTHHRICQVPCLHAAAMSPDPRVVTAAVRLDELRRDTIPVPSKDDFPVHMLRRQIPPRDCPNNPMAGGAAGKNDVPWHASERAGKTLRFSRGPTEGGMVEHLPKSEQPYSSAPSLPPLLFSSSQHTIHTPPLDSYLRVSRRHSTRRVTHESRRASLKTFKLSSGVCRKQPHFPQRTWSSPMALALRLRETTSCKSRIWRIIHSFLR